MPKTSFRKNSDSPINNWETSVTEGVLAFDESDRARSKSTKRIYKVYKQKHKGSGGYVNGQTIVLLLLVTSSITVPALKIRETEPKRSDDF
ncbi:hypothetical protein [Bathymodiolus japonicus methanotrophic gill symbiont]|uniref:hypothetical protein n=1 Tax=Bathymodiolus japonicus methanotrophic gill symbiont TaxID=113269 RepID=UPI001C8D2723|nr:hypothetical protein [Bathymodiolus japonicus methanotrophic gill symbiont]